MSALWPCFLGAFLIQEQPEKVFRFEVNVRTVYVDVFISKEGRAVTGLTSDDFVVLDNGSRQEIEIVNPLTVHWSVLLLLDTSSSVSGKRLQNLRAAAHAFLDGLRSEDEAGLMNFTHVWTLRRGFSEDFGSLHDALDRPVQGVFTGLNDALYAGLNLVREGTGRPMVLVFTDGEDNSSWLTEAELLEVTRKSDAVVHVVGIRSAPRVSRRNTGSSAPTKNPQASTHPTTAEEYLRKIAESTGGRTWYADTSANLREVFLSVLKDMESRYLLSYQLPGDTQSGWHSIEVELKEPTGVEIRAREGYVLPRTTN